MRQVLVILLAASPALAVEKRIHQTLPQVSVRVNVAASQLSVFGSYSNLSTSEKHSGPSGYVMAEGSFYSIGPDGKPVADPALQLLPNRHKFFCYRDGSGEHGLGSCTSTYVTLLLGTLSMHTDALSVREWTPSRVVSEDNSALCVIQRWTFDLVNKRVMLNKLDAPAAPGETCGPPGGSTATALLGSVTYQSTGVEETLFVRMSGTGGKGCRAQTPVVYYFQLYVSAPDRVVFGSDGNPLGNCRVTDLRNWTCDHFSRKEGRLSAGDQCLRFEEVDFAAFSAQRPETTK